MANLFYKYSTSAKNIFLKKYEDGTISQITFKWNGSVPDCDVTEVNSLPPGYQSSTEAEYEDAALQVYSYARFKSLPAGLPPRP